MRFNFLEEKKHIPIQWKKIIYVVGTVLILVLPALHYYNLYSENRMLENEINSIEIELQSVQHQRREFENLRDQLNVLNLMSKEIIDARYYWDQVVLEQGYVIPELISLQNLTIRNNSIFLSGIADNNDYIVNLIRDMEDSEFFNNVKIEKLEVNFRLNASISRKGE
ncbi:MAG: PilN domain-containing protein [Bacillota bacterium]